jgi:hypothetical protein
MPANCPNLAWIVSSDRLLNQFSTDSSAGHAGAPVQELLVFLFAVASGLTVSGIVANIYWLVMKPKDGEQGIAHWLVMAIAGPTVWIDRVTRTFLSMKSAGMMYALTIFVCLYWAFVIGLFTLSIALAI